MITGGLFARPFQSLVRPAQSPDRKHPKYRGGAFSRSNAANHPPAGMIADEGHADAGRVDWLVRARRRFGMTRSVQDSPHASGHATRELNHARLSHATVFFREDIGHIP